MKCPRRTLLGGIATTATIAFAGSAVSASDGSSVEASGDAPDLETLLEYLPASVSDDAIVFRAVDYERRREADEPHESRPYIGPLNVDPDGIAAEVTVTSYDEEYTQPIRILAGDIDPDGDGEPAETDGGLEYERFESGNTDEFAAVTDEFVFVTTDEGTIDDALAAAAGEEDRLLETNDMLQEAIETVGDADSYTVQSVNGSASAFTGNEDDPQPEYIAHAETVLDPDTIEIEYVVAFEDADDVTDEFVERIEADFAYMGTTEEPEATVDGRYVTVSVERDLEAERAVAEHDSPGFLRVDRDIDPDDEYLELEVGRGDPTPVEDLTLELGDEEYDPDIWADGHGKIEEGDTIVVKMEDVEPNTSVSITHDHEMGSSSSGTSILSNLRFEFEYDYETETLSIEYTDDFPLDGDRITIAAHDESPYRIVNDEGERVDPEPTATIQPWDGETVEEGAEATFEDVQPGDEIIVGWDGTSRYDSLSFHRIDAPGDVDFEYEYADDRLTATLEVEIEQPADAYELRVDDDPADVQWADQYETITEPATIELDDVGSGKRVTVVWDGDEIPVGRTRTIPRVDLEYDDGVVEHAGGDAIPASDLELQIWNENGRDGVSLADEIDGTFEEGDTVAIETENPRDVTLYYKEDFYVGSVYIDQ
ncbi:hypothetical protein [Halopiger goleimassiliensis]|uniref:hypothetical protein n=1 Tax=Halopiger goleimassiliensis TaxID=1293048 RepID=UPI000677E6D8|nr:hypothetical protein [Halopiger goleimassiliensis]